MLSDHYYSSKKETSSKWQDRNYHAYANTDKDINGDKYLKQKLDEHNIAVGINAYKIAIALPNLKDELPAVKSSKAFKVKVPAKLQKDFGWQDEAFKLACTLKEKTKIHGFFGVCKASTGKGKTRANARIMYGLSEKGRCRFNVALGLRTLTLQTGSVLKRDLQLDADELALLIGSQAVKDLHIQSKEPDKKQSEELGSESAESLLKDEMSLIESLPEYKGKCAEWFKHDPKILKLLQAPVLVSTIDYLMPANEGMRGGRQIAPMLRLLTSDLVLDEPEDFGLEDLPALCRLVNWAGMLGSRVLLSTATISPSLAGALFSAYQAGRKQFTQVNGEHGETAEVYCAWFDEFKKPKAELIGGTGDFELAHNDFVDKRVTNLKKENKALRKAKIVSLEPNYELKPATQMASVVRKSTEQLHKLHAISIENKQVSVGLIRMANIKPLVQVSKELLSMDAPDNTMIHYCIYHSQFPLLQRSNIEKQLDNALTRHDEKSWLNSSGITKKIKKHKEKHHVFVVMATAVAEVGRDHDYDWAIVEPSSMRSIIQLAGRVQRHRKKEPTCENIHILSQNYKGLIGESLCFVKPGFESINLRYASSDLNELVENNEFSEINAIPRIQTPNGWSLTKGDIPRFKSFNQLEHCAQTIRLIGSNMENNHAAQWWKNVVTWCGELQRIQPFRLSRINDDYCLTLTNAGDIIWKKKVPKTYPSEYQNTEDISKKVEVIKQGQGIACWMKFDLKSEVKALEKILEKKEETVWKNFTHISLERLDENSAEQWQHHPLLGIYKILNKDDYKNDNR